MNGRKSAALTVKGWRRRGWRRSGWRWSGMGREAPPPPREDIFKTLVIPLICLLKWVKLFYRLLLALLHISRCSSPRGRRPRSRVLYDLRRASRDLCAPCPWRFFSSFSVSVGVGPSSGESPGPQRGTDELGRGGLWRRRLIIHSGESKNLGKCGSVCSRGEARAKRGARDSRGKYGADRFGDGRAVSEATRIGRAPGRPMALHPRALSRPLGLTPQPRARASERDSGRAPPSGWPGGEGRRRVGVAMETPSTSRRTHTLVVSSPPLDKPNRSRCAAVAAAASAGRNSPTPALSRKPCCGW
jgi:hypothetical protein